MSDQTEIKCIAIVSPGDMGHAVGRELNRNKYDVITCLDGRSSRTISLADSAGFRSVETFDELVVDADLILSILVPTAATGVADTISAAMKRTSSAPLYADCNAVSISTVNSIEKTICSSGGRFVDASIIGFPPGKAAAPRLYVSGAESELLLQLHGKGIEVSVLGNRVGQASGIKMCYAALTKGTFALQYALSLAAERLGLFDALCAEFEQSQSQVFTQMKKNLPKLPAKSARWVGEMEQIAETFDALNVTPLFHQAAAEIFKMISQTPLGDETPETIDLTRSLAETITAISDGGKRHDTTFNR